MWKLKVLITQATYTRRDHWQLHEIMERIQGPLEGIWCLGRSKENLSTVLPQRRDADLTATSKLQVVSQLYTEQVPNNHQGFNLAITIRIKHTLVPFCITTERSTLNPLHMRSKSVRYIGFISSGNNQRALTVFVPRSG